MRLSVRKRPTQRRRRRWGTFEHCLIVAAWTLFVVFLGTIHGLLTALPGVQDSESMRLFSSSHQQRQLQLTEKPPIPISKVISFLEQWITGLHHRMEVLLKSRKSLTYKDIWQEFMQAAVESLIPWDIEYLQRFPEPRKDDSIFLSIVSFRDENCFNTIHEAFQKAARPEYLFVGLNQQNCYQDCKSGIQENHRVIAVDPDPNCAELFCQSDLGSKYCDHVRVLHVQEEDSLGPMEARFFASKLYSGETYYMQMDAHMIFLDEWDRVSIEMIKAAPSEKPVLSHYPPGHKMNLTAQKPTGRLCSAVFHGTSIRMEGLGKFDHEGLDVPHFAPFIGAGFLFAHANMLREVPFDPLLPYIFMGEEIILSARLWTAGYDLFSPTQAVVGHMYVRKNKPKFWESVSRFLHHQDDLESLVLERIKFQLGFPESARDLQQIKSILNHVDSYGMGHRRPLKDYMDSVGIDVWRKLVKDIVWCESGTPPDYAKHLAHLYRNKTGTTA